MEIDREGHGRPLRAARRRDPQQRAHDLHRGQRDPDRSRSGGDRAATRTLVPLFERMHELFEILNTPAPPPRLDRLRPEGTGDRARRRGDGRGDHRARAQRRAPAHRGVHAASPTRPSRSTSTTTTCPTLYRIHEEPDPLKVEEFEEFVDDARLQPRRAAGRRQAAALPEAGREDARHAGREADRVPDAADDAEGALRPAEPRALRPGGRELHALHVADPPLSGPRRPPHAARVAARADGPRSGANELDGRPAGDRAAHLRARAARRRRRARAGAVEEGPLHGGQGRRRVRGLHHRRHAPSACSSS